jgi:hypothetical protein
MANQSPEPIQGPSGKTGRDDISVGTAEEAFMVDIRRKVPKMLKKIPF